jgi:hypothetical protein
MRLRTRIRELEKRLRPQRRMHVVLLRDWWREEREAYVGATDEEKSEMVLAHLDEEFGENDVVVILGPGGAISALTRGD